MKKTNSSLPTFIPSHSILYSAEIIHFLALNKYLRGIMNNIIYRRETRMQLLKEEYSYLAVLLINMKENLIS
jgi:hypothetical protein